MGFDETRKNVPLDTANLRCYFEQNVESRLSHNGRSGATRESLLVDVAALEVEG